MELKKALELLEIGPEATFGEVRTAYRDMATVWHPDRFSQNPRLREKAEKKLKEANLAYETVKAHLLKSGEGADQFSKETAYRYHNRGRESESAREKNTSGSKAELAAELGTEAVLTMWSFLSKKINYLWREKPPPEETTGKGGSDKKSASREKEV